MVRSSSRQYTGWRRDGGAKVLQWPSGNPRRAILDPAEIASRDMVRCVECGAEYESDEDSCVARFDRLLALDHSRQEPWGSRHGQAFAAFALQHPATVA